MSEYSNNVSNGANINALAVNNGLRNGRTHSTSYNDAFGATVINSRAVNYLLTKLRCKETSGRVK